MLGNFDAHLTGADARVSVFSPGVGEAQTLRPRPLVEQ